MLDAKFFYYGWWEDTRCECSSENSAELCIQTANTEVFKLEVSTDQCFSLCSVKCKYYLVLGIKLDMESLRSLGALESDGRFAGFCKLDGCLMHKNATLSF